MEVTDNEQCLATAFWMACGCGLQVLAGRLIDRFLPETTHIFKKEVGRDAIKGALPIVGVCIATVLLINSLINDLDYYKYVIPIFISSMGMGAGVLSQKLEALSENTL